MSDQYVLEVEFKRNNKKSTQLEKQLIIVDDGSISEFSKLKDDLSKITQDSFAIQYLDEESDLISLGTDDEFKEFTKFVKLSNVRGKVVKLILNCSPPTLGQENQHKMVNEKTSDTSSILSAEGKKWKKKLKSEIKEEILHEIYNNVGASALTSAVTTMCDDANRKGKLNPKKRIFLVPNGNTVETITQPRLEKIECKRKKMMDKATLRAPHRYCFADLKVGPIIMSGLGLRDTMKATVGVEFQHRWKVMNDGTVSWIDVKLQHIWSTPGLEPVKELVNCPSLTRGSTGFVDVKFKAPYVVGTLMSYWHFVFGPEMTQFGHYLTLTVQTKQSKSHQISETETTVKGCNHDAIVSKKLKDLLQKEDQKSKKGALCDGITCPENCRLEASLASAEIAAEMARVAANAALKAASGLQADSQTITSKIEELTKSWNGLHLGDKISDSDINMEEFNEENGAGYILVNKLPSTSGDLTLIESVIEKANVLENKKIENNVALDEKQASPIEHNTDTPIEKGMSESKTCGHSQFVTPPSFSTPILETNINSPPTRFTMYSTQQHPTHGFPIFPPQNSASHPIVFPPPPPVNYFSPTKFNPVHYPPPPTFPPLLPTPMLPQPFNPQFLPHQPSMAPAPPVVHSQDGCPVFVPPRVYNINVPPENHNKHNLSASKLEASVANQNIEAQPLTGNSEPSPNEATADETPLSSPAENHQETTSDHMDHSGTVPILPPGLVDGAINVATNAYSTALNAINFIVPKNQEFDPVFENNMVLLVEMGFGNVERNARLLKRFHNDISQVIGFICSAPAGDNLDID